MAFKKAGRKPKKEKDKVISKGVYLRKDEWKKIEDRYESGTKAMREVVLPTIN